jgi:hypothetical protein
MGAPYSKKIILEAYKVPPSAESAECNAGFCQTTEIIVDDEKGGAAQVVALAAGKVNELPVGTYKICYATKESQGDDEDDFKMLSLEIEILPDTATRPGMNFPQSILLGQELTVQWTSTMNLQTRLQSQNSWIGLFRNGTCMPKHGSTAAASQNQDLSAQIGTSQHTELGILRQGRIQTDVHECYVSYRFIQSGVESGSVTFSQADYKVAGVYDVRFFQGDSRNEQGRVCKGILNAPHGTYIQCSLEAALIRSPIEIIGDRSKMDDLAIIPGMEMHFDGNSGRNL